MTVWQARLKSVRDLLDMYELHMEAREYDDAKDCLDDVRGEIYTMRNFK